MSDHTYAFEKEYNGKKYQCHRTISKSGKRLTQMVYVDDVGEKMDGKSYDLNGSVEAMKAAASLIAFEIISQSKR